ncbi:MAG: apolipoprotein N-acyltransferase [Micrococcales bacterium]|nr:apolipoprotein N-acyltransferase [Micrococcales bacterium]
MVGGAVTVLAFPDVGFWPAAPVGIALLVLALDGDSARWNALLGWLYGLAFFLPTLWWAREAVGRLPWFALSVAEAAYIALVAVAWTWARRSPFLPARLAPGGLVVLWLAGEELRSTWPFGGFPWGRLAFSQSDSPLLALAWLGGAPLVSAVVVVLGWLLARAFLALRDRRTRAALVSVAVAAGLTASGLLVPLSTGAETGTVRVGIVQGNVPERGLEAFGRPWQVLDNHVRGTEALLEQVEPGELDLVVWPENAADIDPQADSRAAVLVDGAAAAIGAPILLGTVRYPNADDRYNTSVLWVPGVGVVAHYTKQHPAPFAEYVPARDLVRPFSAAVDLIPVDMRAGTEPGLVIWESTRLEREVGLGVVICFEVAYDALVRSAVTSGGEVILVQTNNASFGYTAESTQQLAMTRLRAVEHGRATVQISTVGVSAFVAPDGTVSERTELFTADQRVATLPLRDSLTPATRLGRWPALVASALAVALVVAGAVATIRRRSRPEAGSLE